jgi:hypothetical protein
VEHKKRHRRLVLQGTGIVLVVAGIAVLNWYSERSAKPIRQYLKGAYHPELGFEHGLVPPDTFKISWADKQACPVADFGFSITTERGFAVDTFAGTVTKDMVGQPDTTVTLRLDKKTMQALRDLYLRTGLSELPEPAPPYGSQEWKDRAHGPGIVDLEIRCGGTTKQFSWHTGHFVGDQHIDEWRRLWWFAGSAFLAAIYSPEYQALPKAPGGYI